MMVRIHKIIPLEIKQFLIISCIEVENDEIMFKNEDEKKMFEDDQEMARQLQKELEEEERNK